MIGEYKMKNRDYITAGAYYRLMKDMLIEANKGIITALHLNKRQQNEFYKVLEKWRMLETKLNLENMAVNDTNFNGRTIDLFYGTVTDKNISYSDTDKQIMQKINGILMSFINDNSGEWKEVYDENEDRYFKIKFYCSACGNWQTYGKTNFCMNCGAKMENAEI